MPLNRLASILALSVYCTLPIFSAQPNNPVTVSSDILNSTSSLAADDQQPASEDQKGAMYPSPNAPKVPPAIYRPYTPAQKFKFATQDVFGPVALVGVGLSAGFNQLTNTPSEWGQGAAGYGRRYANAFGVNLSYQYFNATLGSVLHEDPRYFPSIDRSTKGRLKHAVAHVFMTRKDNGEEGFAYARWGSAFGAGFLENSWNPRSNNRVSDGLENGAAILGIDFGIKVAQEFIPFLRHLTP